jgi:hypothetical protein
MMITQDFPPLSVLGQSSTPRKPVESSPEIAITLKLVNVTIEVPVLVTVEVARDVEPG